MVKVAMGLMSAAAMLVAAPAMAHGQEIPNDLDRCGADARGPAVLAVLTADCLPVLLCDRQGSVAGVAHAGWRGLATGVIENTVARMQRALAAVGAAHRDVPALFGFIIGAASEFRTGPEIDLH